MYYQIRKPWYLRLEFFGGLLINRYTGKIYNLEMKDAILLLSLNNGFSFADSTKIMCSIIKDNSQKIDLSAYIKNKVINKTKTKNSKLNIKAYITDLKNKIDFFKEQKTLSAPIEASIYPTSFCQLNCKFCYYKEKRKQYLTIHSYKDWCKIINDLYHNGTLYLSILGGEPTLFADIDKILNYVDKIGFKTTITTNGVNIKNTTFDIITKSKFITPTISLQSVNSSLNKQLMGIDSEPILKTIEKFLINGKTPRINTVYTVQTESDLFSLIDFLELNKIEDFGLNIFMDSFDNTYSHSFEECKELNTKIQKYIFERKYNLKYSMQGCLLYSAYPSLESPIHNEFDLFQYGCEAGKTKIEIMPNGDVYPCAAFDYSNFKYLNAFDNDIIDLWLNADYLQLLRHNKNEDERCKECKFYDFCNGGCPARNIKTNKSLYKKGDKKCQLLMNKIL